MMTWWPYDTACYTRSTRVKPRGAQTAQEFLSLQQEAENVGTTDFPLGGHSFFYRDPKALSRTLPPLINRFAVHNS
jgi:hypothetical protein